MPEPDDDRAFSPQPKPRARIFGAIEDAIVAKRIKVQAYAAVDARDQHRCRCCGRRGNPFATDALGRIHRAHIRDASLGGELASGNLVSLDARCHQLVHAKQLTIIGHNADAVGSKALRFDIAEAAVIDVFGARVLPPHVHITAPRRRA